jgi:nucleotide-binding universal stress UspA family protein
MAPEMTVRRLLVGLDGRDGGHDALELSRVLASESGGTVVATTVLSGGSLSMERALLTEKEAQEAEPIFEKARAKVGDFGMETRVFGGGSPAGILTELVEREELDAIVVGSPHRGTIGKVLIGNVASSLLNGAPCDVFVAPKGYSDEKHGSLRTITVAYEGTPEAKAALQRAEELARLSNATIKVLTVVSPPVVVAVPGGGYAPQSPADPNRVINEAVHSIDSKLGAEGRRLDGSPAERIAEACEQGVDLLVTGSRGYGPMTRVLLGSVSRKLINEAPCPVLVVPRP